MCNIWQKKNYEKEIAPEIFNRLPRNLSDINITGGEPFLREDLIEVAGVIVKRCPKANIVISTNGFETDKICEQTREILKFSPNIGVAVSMDGIGEKHNEIRGVKNGYNKVLMTISRLKAMGVKNLKIAFTLGNYNVKELASVYALAEFFGLEFSLALVHSGENYFSKYNAVIGDADMVNTLRWLIAKELGSGNYKKWARAYFARGIIEFLKNGKRVLPDYSGKLNIFIDPFGNIYANNVSDKKIGHLADIDKGLDCSEPANKKNWMMCSARQSIKKHWFRAGWWILWNK